MISKKLAKKLHSIALENNITDTLAEIIVLTPFLFQKRKMEEHDVTKPIKFYHKYIGNFYIKKRVLTKIREKNGTKESK